MPDHVDETVERLTELHRQHHERSTCAQRLTNRVTNALGRPAAITAVIAVCVSWVLGNLTASRLNLNAFEQLPFSDLALVLGFVAVVIALLILSTQRHGEELAERRAEVTLQIALLSERKVAKVIALLEEQRAETLCWPHGPTLKRRRWRSQSILPTAWRVSMSLISNGTAEVEELLA